MKVQGSGSESALVGEVQSWGVEVSDVWHTDVCVFENSGYDVSGSL